MSISYSTGVYGAIANSGFSCNSSTLGSEGISCFNTGTLPLPNFTFLTSTKSASVVTLSLILSMSVTISVGTTTSLYQF